MQGEEELWRSTGLRRFQVVQCVVTGHRGRFGVDVEVTSPANYSNAFIDFVLLAEGEHVPPEEFPPVGTVLDAITIAFMPDGELRLSAKPSEVARLRAEM